MPSGHGRHSVRFHRYLERERLGIREGEHKRRQRKRERERERKREAPACRLCRCSPSRLQRPGPSWSCHPRSCGTLWLRSRPGTGLRHLHTIARCSDVFPPITFPSPCLAGTSRSASRPNGPLWCQPGSSRSSRTWASPGLGFGTSGSSDSHGQPPLIPPPLDGPCLNLPCSWCPGGMGLRCGT